MEVASQRDRRIPLPGVVPDAEGKFPVLLLRLPYGKQFISDFGDHEFFVPRGYVVVIQDTRGRLAVHDREVRHLGVSIERCPDSIYVNRLTLSVDDLVHWCSMAARDRGDALPISAVPRDEQGTILWNRRGED